MDLEKLKSVYDAARSLRGHRTQEEAAKHVGKSLSTVNRVLAGDLVSQPCIDAILAYSYEAGLHQSIEELGLDPDAKVKSLTVAE